MDYSVAIIGGGPAGSLAAWRLAQAGVDVLVVDRPRPNRVEAAEILSPEGRTILAREGLWDVLPRDLTWPCPTIGTAWESPDPVWTWFGGHRPESAWHLDRIRFDAWLLSHIRARDVIVESASVDSADRTDDGWTVTYRSDDVRRSVSARCLLLASGRSTAPIHLARRLRIDTLCLVAGTSAPDLLAPDALMVEATADGWWYSAPLPNKRLFAGWMTDLSLVGHGRYEDAAAAALRNAPVHARRIGPTRFRTPIGSASWVTSPGAGLGWMAIGDAALARDPIGGDGLTAALRSACTGADVAIRALGGDASAWTAAAAEADIVSAEYQARRLNLYRAAATRWPESAFWRRASSSHVLFASGRTLARPPRD